MSDEEQGLPALGRRGLLLGGGVLAGLAAAGGRPAGAAPAGLAGMGVSAQPLTSPIVTGIGSAPLNGYVYRAVGMYEFLPFNPAAAKTWGGQGVYSANVGTSMRACVDIPSGALVADVEYYVYNSSANQTVCDSYLYVPGLGTISSVGASALVPGGGSSIGAYRAAVSMQGPYPLGAKLYVSIGTPADGTIQINGARVGLLLGGGQLAAQPKQVRVYDTTAGGGAIATGETRSVTLPASYLPPGTTAVILDVTTSGASAAGNLKVFGSSSPPSSPNVYYGAGVTSAAEITVAVSPNRKVKILASRTTHAALDIVGTIA
ncbi:hypothetical protein [Methylocella sp.]|uniref:hypothetical protein n=1 Tax=Methylocella sp. TaxID=1978226 RepID=UPI0035B0B6CC